LSRPRCARSRRQRQQARRRRRLAALASSPADRPLLHPRAGPAPASRARGRPPKRFTPVPATLLLFALLPATPGRPFPAAGPRGDCWLGPSRTPPSATRRTPAAAPPGARAAPAAAPPRSVASPVTYLSLPCPRADGVGGRARLPPSHELSRPAAKGPLFWSPAVTAGVPRCNGWRGRRGGRGGVEGAPPHVPTPRPHQQIPIPQPPGPAPASPDGPSGEPHARRPPAGAPGLAVPCFRQQCRRRVGATPTPRPPIGHNRGFEAAPAATGETHSARGPGCCAPPPPPAAAQRRVYSAVRGAVGPRVPSGEIAASSGAARSGLGSRDHARPRTPGPRGPGPAGGSAATRRPQAVDAGAAAIRAHAVRARAPAAREPPAAADADADASTARARGPRPARPGGRPPALTRAWLRTPAPVAPAGRPGQCGRRPRAGLPTAGAPPLARPAPRPPQAPRAPRAAAAAGPARARRDPR
jgi:hypothetical protein